MSTTMETEFAGLMINEEEEEILHIIHFPAMKSTMENLWHPVRGVQIQELGGKRYLF
ncbi:hypothetical protein Goklo_021192 [Gossypium klotzschianum]|uniref:DUF4283 domain-containing protein n=1 Tax=Gossypium klotzschianum TaxID=34286 RepID=A0A7J8UUB4_9ROSI|nr:hypothetical protein [Gossypium klotzschianum]